MRYRLHFTDGAMAQREALGLDQDAVRIAIDAGTKLQRQENVSVARHKGLEVEVRTVGQDYTVTRIVREGAWPVSKASLPYLQRVGA
ncbi:MAG: hypothetical protein LC624_11005 [Halobacteriales archaeon]|nr:hypothetical protein [Halobacteriales archaeon]